MNDRKQISAAIGVAMAGAVALQQAFSRPEMANIRAVDMVGLTGAGFAFGTAFVLIMSLRGKRRLRASEERESLPSTRPPTP